MSAAEELGAILHRLAPPGHAWPKAITGTARALLEGLAGTPAEVERRAAMLLVEFDPRSTLELLPDFERLLGLPTACATGEPQTIVERRTAVVSRLTAVRGSSPAELISLAATLGLTIEVVEYVPFAAGIGYAGAPLSNGPWLYTVTFRAPVATGQFFRAGSSGAGDSLFALSNVALECGLEDAVPAHVFPRFDYDLVADPSYQPWDPARCRPLPLSAAPRVVPPALVEV
jgi:uncharacterized protein YmfQ (DUF2313 family)